MNIQISGAMALTLLLAILSMIWGFGKLLAGQFEKRLEERSRAQDELRKSQFDQLGRDIAAERAKVDSVTDRFDRLVATLPLEYLRREDWIRFTSSIERQFERVIEMIAKMGNPRP